MGPPVKDSGSRTVLSGAIRPPSFSQRSIARRMSARGDCASVFNAEEPVISSSGSFVSSFLTYLQLHRLSDEDQRECSLAAFRFHARDQSSPGPLVPHNNNGSSTPTTVTTRRNDWYPI